MIFGLHHISLKCGTTEEFEKTKSFYLEVLGFKPVREWSEGCMIDFGNGMLEIFRNGAGIKTKGALRHIAFATDDVDEVVMQVKEAGYEVFIEPKNIVINSNRNILPGLHSAPVLLERKLNSFRKDLHNTLIIFQSILMFLLAFRCGGIESLPSLIHLWKAMIFPE